jgi:ribonuclease J
MKLTINRPSHEMGGECIVLHSEKSKILIDFGVSLTNDFCGVLDYSLFADKTIKELRLEGLLPDIDGLYEGEVPEYDGILISHSHLEHYWYLQYVSNEIPIYLNQGAKELIEISANFLGRKAGHKNLQVIKKNKHIKFNDISIEPFTVDNPGIDSLAFLIESEKNRIFYSGDFRMYENESYFFDALLERPPQDIDYLIIGGIVIESSGSLCENEKEVRLNIEQTLRESNEVKFLYASLANIERIVSAYKACLKMNSILVIDLYTAFVLERLKKVSSNIPKFNWKNIRVKFFKDQADQLSKAGYSGLLYVFNQRKIDFFEINRKKGEILMLVRDASLFPVILKELKNRESSIVIYSMDEECLPDTFKEYCVKKNLKIKKVNTSGYLSIEDINMLVNALEPEHILPLNTLNQDTYEACFGDRNKIDSIPE